MAHFNPTNDTLALRQAQGVYEYKAVTRSSISSSSSVTRAAASGGKEYWSISASRAEILAAGLDFTEK